MFKPPWRSTSVSKAMASTCSSMIGLGSRTRCDPATGRLIEGPLPEEDLSFEVDGVMVHIRVRA